ncbi:methyl-accepting chemotaxis protein [Ornithinibacillus scapharcae]|uniref:methyl-accepting chemotaxis protein n=1 Tax=Ornithinibacillus scapharcae TaxID=1147159 RepID=UPI000225B9F9|nr:methyl-accepting chemotaxis protein [Ornithinibacillus scapharcae]
MSKLNQIKVKLPLMMALLLIIPMSVVGLLSYNETKVLEHAVVDKEVMENLDPKFEKIFLEYEGIISSLAGLEEMNYQGYSFPTEIKDGITNMPSVNDPVKTTFYEKFLTEEENKHDYLLNTYIATLDGEFYLSNIPPKEVDLTEFDPREREWYTKAEAAAGEVIWTQPYMDTGTGKSTITLAKAMTDSNGSIIGVVGLDFDMQKLAILVRLEVLKTASIVGGIALVIGIILVFLFVRRFNRDLAQVQVGMEKLAEGDLTVETIDTKQQDELGQLIHGFNRMVRNLRDLVTNVIKTSEQVAASSEQLNANSEETSKATEHITLSIQEVSSGAEDQLTSMQKSMEFVRKTLLDVHQIQESTHSVTEASQIGSIQAKQGQEMINQTIEQMQVINQNTRNTSTIINDLDIKSKEIEKILTIINDIADQTNLLALNAAIEAARAGEHGKGFAVVADQVRKLAEQSSESTSQISQIIGEIQSYTGKAVDSMEVGEKAVDKGTKFVNTAGESFTEISTSIDGIVQKMEGVAQAISKISANTDDLVESMENVSSISERTSNFTQEVAGATEEQTASMQEVASATRVLADMALELQHLASQFKI